MVKEVKHNEVEVGHKECENGQQKQKLNSLEMGGGDEHCMSLQDKKKKGKCSYTHKVLRKNIIVMSWPNFRLLTKLSFYLVKL